jgi:carbon storage regulator
VLVLRRRPGESIFLGEDVEIEILEINSQGAKIGIRAPRDMVILRKELKVAADQNRASAISPEIGQVTEILKKLQTGSRLLPAKR